VAVGERTGSDVERYFVLDSQHPLFVVGVRADGRKETYAELLVAPRSPRDCSCEVPPTPTAGERLVKS